MTTRLHSTALANAPEAARAANRLALERKGVNPFPAKAWHPEHRIGDLQSLFNVHADLDLANRPTVRIAGRISAIRSGGGVFFADLFQAHAEIQLWIARGEVSAESWHITRHLDIGDIIGVIGRLTKTNRGELSVRVEALSILCKPARTPAIGKQASDGTRHGAQADRGALLRDQRHIKLLTDPKVFQNIHAYADILWHFRDQMRLEGFLELQTSVMGPFYGGAAATPFTTRSKATGQEMYLRVSPEPDLKRALAGGLERIYEIGRNFRNEGIDATHQPSFTAFEAYQAYADYHDMMALTERLISRAAKSICGSFRLPSNGKVLDFEPPWPRLRMTDLVAAELGLSASDLSLETLERAWDERKTAGPRPRSWGEFVVGLFEESVEKQLIGPCFVIDHPADISPLTKRHRDNPLLSERFEAYVNGLEIANAYSELNDPVEQRQRLEEQDTARDEPYGVDAYFLSAIDDGMPQAGGLGIGLDRIVMILTGAERLSDVIPFPNA